MGKTLIKIVIGIVIIGGALGYMVYNAMQSSWAYYISVDDLTTEQSQYKNYTLRVAGIVEKESVSRDLKNMQLNFKLKGKDISIPVSFIGTVPDNFTEDREVVVEGQLDANGVFQAGKVMTKCESKYEAKVQKSDKETE